MKRLLLIPFFIIVALCGCTNRPKGVLSRSAMEDVLFDYHMMQAVIDHLPDSERMEQTREYIDAVFEKHGITEAQFDTSIIYYNRHAKDMARIYSRLKARFSEANEAMLLQTGNSDLNAVFAGGDTANIWAGAKILLLANHDMMRTESFTLLCDSSTHRGDQFTLMFTPVFLKNRNDQRGHSVTAGLTIVYSDGRTAGTTQQAVYSSTQQLTLKAIDSLAVEKICFFFHYNATDDDASQSCIVKDLALVQMHEKAEPPMPELKPDTADTAKAKEDSATVKPDTAPAVPKRILTPEEVRKANQTGTTINIQSAPSVRRPNSIGPRRRKSGGTTSKKKTAR